MIKIVIIGGMAAGCKAAARLSRISEDYQITIVERKPLISFSACGFPLYASGELEDFLDLTRTPNGIVRNEEFFYNVKGIKVLTNTEVENIDSIKRTINCKDLKRNKEIILDYDELIFTTGAKPIHPKFSCPVSQRISSFHSPFDVQEFRKLAQKGNIGKAVIIGGGFIGCELTESLSNLWGIETVLIEKEKSLLLKFLDPEISKLVENHLRMNKIQIHISSDIEKIEIEDQELPIVHLKNGDRILSDYVFYNLGVKPETSLAQRAGIKVGEYDGIIVDEKMKTNLPNIWAAGDCVETQNIVTDKSDYFPLGSLANRMGRVVADSISNKKTFFNGSVGAVSLKLFNMVIAAAGLTEKKAKEHGFNTGNVIGTWSDRPDYHPDTKDLFGKLVYEKSNLRLLGLQLIGEGEVTRYIDTFSELLSNRKTIFDLMNIEHAYTPSHSSPISPLNYLGAMAINQVEDDIKNFNSSHFPEFDGIFIDVREQSEISSFPFNKETSKLSISEIRKKTFELNFDQPVMFLCQKGPRSYESAGFFKKMGYQDVSYLGGGILFWNKMKSEL